jgi:Zn finger protein HypA/HybF involved in hydrogenase expression
MKNSTKTAGIQDKFVALRLAELKATDKEDFQTCVADMQRTASLNESEAIAVAKAIRAKYLPNLAREAGFTKETSGGFLNLDDSHEETADFAKEMTNDDEEDMPLDGANDLNIDEDDEEASEVEDNDIATFEIEVPADMVDAAQKAVQEALDRVLGGNDSDEDMDMEDDDMSEEMDMDSDDDDMEVNSDESQMHKNSRRDNKMNRQSLAARRAEREEILRKFASEEEHVEASGSFKYSDEMNQYPGEMKYPTMKLDGENKMKGENPDFAKTKVPTKNPKNLQLKDSMDAVGFEGSGESSDFEYEVDWKQMDRVVPTTGEAKLKGFEIPSEMDLQARKTTVAYKEEEAVEAKSKYKCEDCGTVKEMTDREAMESTCETCVGKKEVEAQAPLQNAINNKKLETEEKTTQNALDTIDKVNISSVDTARIKAAYSCATKLALAGIINSNETDDYAGQLLEDGLRADVMIKNTQLLLRSAQASAERVAAASAERLNVRTASTMGISTSPALYGSSNSAALDIQAALKGTWSMPQIED